MNDVEAENKRLREQVQVRTDALAKLRLEREAVQRENERLRERMLMVYILAEAPTDQALAELESQRTLEPSRTARQAAAPEPKDNPSDRKASRSTHAKDKKQPRSETFKSENTSKSLFSRKKPTLTPAQMVVLGGDLRSACTEGELTKVRDLLDMGVDPNVIDERSQWTPLHCAASAGAADIVLELCGRPGIMVNPVNSDGNSALHYLVRHTAPETRAKSQEALRQLVATGADVNCCNRNKETPLHAASLRNNEAAVNFLLSASANPNAQTIRGETCLHYAARANALELARILLRFGGDPRITAKKLHSPLDIALQESNQQMVDLFRDPQYALIPLTLHSVGMERFVPQFVAAFPDPTLFKQVTDDQLRRMHVPDELRGRLLGKLQKMSEAKVLNMEELEWEISWDAIVIEKEIGSGNYGVVYKGLWKGREVAVKQLRTKGKPELVDEFLGEIEVMKHVRLHENVVNLLGVCKSPHIAIISEFLPQGSLDKWLKELKLWEDTLTFLRLARGAASGMCFLHEQKIIHRDLAARNMLLTLNESNERNVKIADFGMSRLTQTGLHTDQSGFGPLKWMAPEALSYEFVFKTDCWAYAITLIEMLTADIPFPGEKPLAVALAVRDEGRKPTAPACAPAEVATMMDDCWSYEPDDRPSFDQIVTRLDKYTFRLKSQKQRTAPDRTKEDAALRK